jgi:SAM-dependent methyltransferase
MPLSLLVAIAAVSLGGTVLVLALLHPYSSGASPSSVLSVDIAQLGGFTRRGLILSSVLGLYLELLLIRWISSEIRIFAYFKNFVLIACFLGFGLGCYLCRRAVSILAFVVPLLFITLIIELPWRPLRSLVQALPVLLGATSEVQIWGVGTSNLSTTALVGLLLASIVTLPLFALLSVVFIPIGQLVGYYLETARNGIAAYSINVLASLAGIALYTALCFADQPPIVWFIVAAILATALFWRASAARAAVAAALAICVLLIAFDTEPGQTYWSPYQKLNLQPLEIKGERVGYELRTNSSWFQKILNFSDDFVRRHRELFQRVPVELTAFNIAYHFVPHPRSVLILGAGMGNDVAAALRNGSQHVTAVDIDPLIIRLGRQLHPERPYASPRVTVVVDDARSFIQNTTERFDLIVFSALDSHTTSSNYSNIRIDNYVYTREALEAGKRLLTPDGVLVLRFQVQRAWIAGRLHDLMVAVFGYEPVPLQLQTGENAYATSGSFFVAGSQEKLSAALASPSFGPFLRANSRMPMEHVTLATDDWPYLYQREPGIPTSVATISVLLIVVCFVAAQRIGLGARSLHLEFFFLGAGFMLLEAQIISRMALLFGTTWIVNSIVISVLLLLIIAANGIAAIAPRLRYEIGYAGIVLTIAAAYFIPLQAFFFRSFALKAIVATLFLCLPVFFAGIVFIKRFAASGFAAEAIGSNLLGALAGGIAESASLWLGLRWLLVIAAVFYGAAWISSRRSEALATVPVAETT